MRMPLSACCKKSPCAEIDGCCDTGIVSIFRIVVLAGSFRDGARLDEPLPLVVARALADSLRESLLEKS